MLFEAFVPTGMSQKLDELLANDLLFLNQAAAEIIAIEHFLNTRYLNRIRFDAL